MHRNIKTYRYMTLILAIIFVLKVTYLLTRCNNAYYNQTFDIKRCAGTKSKTIKGFVIHVFILIRIIEHFFLINILHIFPINI